MVATLIPPTAVYAEESDPVPYSTDSVTLDDIVKAAANVVRENEGSYSSVNPDDNGALSIGWIQWHANRALSLIRDIINANTVLHCVPASKQKCRKLFSLRRFCQCVNEPPA